MKNLIDPTLPFASASSPSKSLESDYTTEFDAWRQTPTPTTRSALIKKVQPVLDTAISSYAGATPSPNVKSQARLMALKAFESYNPSKGNLKNHLLSQLQSLRRTVGQEQSVISIPERVALERNHLVKAEDQLRDQLGRDPSDAEIANYTGLSFKRLAYIRRARQGTNTGGILDEEGEVYSPPSNIPGADDAEAAWHNFVYHDLGPLDQAVMDYTLGLHGSPKLATADIANRLGVTASAISQRKSRIQQMLDERQNLNLL